MRILLDTHVWLWMVSDAARIPDDQRAILEDPQSDLFLSAAAIWELAIKHAAGKLRYTGSPATQIPIHVQRSGVRPLSMSIDHALAAADLPMHHRDPFDRMMVAQSRLEDMTFATADHRLEAYDVPVMRIGA